MVVVASIQKKMVKKYESTRNRGVARQRAHWVEIGSEYSRIPRQAAQRACCWGRHRHLVKSLKHTMSFKSAMSFFRLAALSSAADG
jgi:hypothetical protein